jgi:uncharacterized protein YdbL (DUF1318 family)
MNRNFGQNVFVWSVLVGAGFSVFLNCTLRAPNITFTQTQTASERQMVGEDREIERDGWLISSTKSSSAGADLWQKDVSEGGKVDKEFLILLKKHAFLSAEIQSYRWSGQIGESSDGKIKRIPGTSSPTGISESELGDILAKINATRSQILSYRIKKYEESNPGKNTEEIKTKLTQYYFERAEIGEWIEPKVGKWEKKD